MSREGTTTWTGVGFDAAMDFGMSFQIMLSHEVVTTDTADELPVTEMGLDVRFDIFLSAKCPGTSWKYTHPAIIIWTRTIHECRDLFGGNASIVN